MSTIDGRVILVKSNLRGSTILNVLLLGHSSPSFEDHLL